MTKTKLALAVTAAIFLPVVSVASVAAFIATASNAHAVQTVANTTIELAEIEAIKHQRWKHLDAELDGLKDSDEAVEERLEDGDDAPSVGIVPPDEAQFLRSQR